MGQDSTKQTLNFPFTSEEVLEPPAEWAELRQQCPVAPVKLPSGDEAVLVTRYHDVKSVLSDPRWTRKAPEGKGVRVSKNKSGGPFNGKSAKLIPDSGKEHQAWRRQLSKWFTAKRMASLRPRIEAMAEQLIDRMLGQGQPADLKASLGFPLPVWVICDILGVPDADRDKFSHWSDTRLNLDKYEQDEIDAAQAEFDEYMHAHVEAKRAEPGEDLLSELIREGENGTAMSDATLVATGQGLLVAGHETTANMIGKMVAMLLADRTRWEQLLADRSLVRTAVEESLRFDPNAGFGMVRYLHEDTEISGTAVPRGTTVVCSMAAANRDESVFDDAGEMDLRRSPNPHLAFGSGAHSCLGQALARTELQTVLEVLLRRLPALDLAVPVEELPRIEGLLVGGFREVPVRW